MASLYNDQGELNLFGFTISKKQKEETSVKSFVPEANNVGGTEVSSYSGAAYNAYSIDIDPSGIKNENDLIYKYREMSLVADIDLAISEIVDEFLVLDEADKAIVLDFDEEFADKYSDKTKKLIIDEFENIVKLLTFNQNGHDIFRNFYIDGRLAYHKVVDAKNPKLGIAELRPIDVAKLKRVVEIQKEKDPVTNATIIKGQSDYYIYAESGFSGDNKTGLKIAPDSIAYITSGLMDRNANLPISYLHKAIRPLNQLRMMEDSDVIYRMTRAPERRVFYIDTNGMARTKAEQYIKDVMARYKNKQVYDSVTGTLKDDKKHLSILEDFWLPRANGGKGTEITTLPSGCLAMDTKVKILDGRDLSISEIESEMKDGKVLWTYSCHPTTGEIVPGVITWAGVTQKSAKVMKLTFDNGEELICTPDHKFPLYGKGFVEAKDLEINESMIPIYTKNENISEYKKLDYTKFFDNNKKKWIFTHRMVGTTLRDTFVEEYVFDDQFKDSTKNVVHHKNFNRYDNSPDNLCYMSWDDHSKLHAHFGFSKYASIKGGLASAAKLKYMKEFEHDNYKLYCDKVSVATIKYISELNEADREIRNQTSRDNFMLGTERLQDLLQDSEFYDEFCQNIKDSWTDEMRQEKSELAAANNVIMWQDEDFRKDFTKKLKGEINETILKGIIDLVGNKTTHQMTIEMIVDELNKNEFLLNEFININKNKRSKFDKTKFTASILRKGVKKFGYSGWHDFRKTCYLHNHRLVKIEYLDEPIEVGTLTIDGFEMIHNYHTFALTCGVFTKNSGLGALENTEYFQTKLWQALALPTSRMQTGQGSFNIGRGNEITRDEIKFAKFIAKLRRRFNSLFMDLLKTQLLLKGITTAEDWDAIKNSLVFKYGKDNFFAELKESDMFKERIANATAADPFVGKYFSQRHVMREMLKMTDKECDDMLDQMKKETPTEVPPDAVPE